MRDKHPVFILEINGRTVLMGRDSLNCISSGFVGIEGIGLPVITVQGPDYLLEGELTDDPVLLKICRTFLADINDDSPRFKSLLHKPLPIPSP